MFGAAVSGPKRILETKIRTIHEISLCGGNIYAYFIGPGNYFLQRNTPKSLQLIIHLRVVGVRKGSFRVCGISMVRRCSIQLHISIISLSSALLASKKTLHAH